MAKGSNLSDDDAFDVIRGLGAACEALSDPSTPPAVRAAVESAVDAAIVAVDPDR